MYKHDAELAKCKDEAHEAQMLLVEHRTLQKQAETLGREKTVLQQQNQRQTRELMGYEALDGRLEENVKAKNQLLEALRLCQQYIDPLAVNKGPWKPHEDLLTWIDAAIERNRRNRDGGGKGSMLSEAGCRMLLRFHRSLCQRHLADRVKIWRASARHGLKQAVEFRPAVRMLLRFRKNLCQRHLADRVKIWRAIARHGLRQAVEFPNEVSRAQYAGSSSVQEGCDLCCPLQSTQDEGGQLITDLLTQ